MAEIEEAQPNRNEKQPEISPTPIARPASGMSVAQPAIRFSVSLPWDQVLFLATSFATIYLRHKADMANLDARRLERQGPYPHSRF